MSQTATIRRRVLKWAERLLIVGALVFIAYRLGPQLGALIGIGWNADPAPAFSVTTLDGTHIDSNELRGKVVVLNFWATWCGPCRLEMPSLQSLHEDLADNGVVVLGLSTDTGPISEIEDVLLDRGITYPVARATRDQVQAFGGVPMIPTTIIIDKNGMIRHRIEGLAAGPVLSVAAERLIHR